MVHRGMRSTYHMSETEVFAEHSIFPTTSWIARQFNNYYFDHMTSAHLRQIQYDSIFNRKFHFSIKIRCIPSKRNTCFFIWIRFYSAYNNSFCKNDTNLIHTKRGDAVFYCGTVVLLHKLWVVLSGDENDNTAVINHTQLKRSEYLRAINNK